MSTELLALLVQGGAIVALYLWNRDLQEQRKQERAERLADAAVMRTVGEALGKLTDSIEALMDGRPARAPRERR